ncbi:MAG: uracil-DNA glycosylase [Acidobacteriota bacterium]
MSKQLPPSLADLLGHLDDIGFRELYLGTPSVTESSVSTPRSTSVSRATTETPPPAASPPRSRPTASAAPPAQQSSLLDTIERADLPTTPEARREALDAIRATALACTACRLAERRNQVVFADGDPHADLMFIGEGPGAEEDRRGLPFVGAAGQLLDKIIKAIDFDRRSVYIANIVKCRPPNNRDPQADEVAACRGYLESQIDLVQPRVIVLLGKVAAQTLLGSKQSLGRMRGRWWQVRGVDTRVTYHPAALLRSSSWKRPTWEDMQIVRDRLRESAEG